VFHPVQGHYMGNLFIMVGIIQIVQIDARVATVRILHSYGPITSGDGAMRFAPPPPREPAPAERALATMTGMIIDLPPQQFLIGQSNVVYIDRGHHDGLHIGDRLDIFRLGGGLPMRLIGEAKVLATEETTATASIVRSTAPVLRGDRLLLKAAPGQAAAKNVTPETLSEELDRLAGAGQPPVATREGSLEEQLAALARKLEFEPGEALTKPSGLPILKQIGALLKMVSDKRIVIAGHTDNRPIGPTLKHQLPSNQALSEARASSVARFLTEEGGLKQTQVSAIGYANTRPIASNATEEGRKKNRRIDIILRPQAPTPPAPDKAETHAVRPEEPPSIAPVQDAPPSMSPSPETPAQTEDPLQAIPTEPPLELPPAEEPLPIPKP